MTFSIHAMEEKMSFEWANHQIMKFCNLARSIVLTGSHAINEATPTSDVDFIVVAHDAVSAESIRASIRNVSKGAGRPFLDVKIYTADEFKKVKSGKEHLFLWTALSNGRVLCGEDITRGIDLNERRVVNTVWQELETITRCSDKLDMNTQFTGCCFSVYQALTTIYFVERFVLKESNFLPKKAFIRQMLENAHNIVRERYYYVTRKVEAPEFTRDIELPSSVDRRFEQSDYRVVRKQCGKAVEYLQHAYPKIVDWAEA